MRGVVALPSVTFALAVLGLALGLVLGAAAPAGAQSVRHQPPVDGQVLRGFEAPGHDYGPGHRGVDLQVRPGQPVRATGAGEVSFAGAVAGETWVTVRHDDGLRTSVGALRTPVVVRLGQRVVAGDVLGRATGVHGSGLTIPDAGLHVGVRRGETYIDPQALWERPPPRPSLVGPGGWRGSHPVVAPYAPHEPGRWVAGDSPRARAPVAAFAPNHHHRVVLPGFATAGPHDPFRSELLGYGEEDISMFSYRGCDPSPQGCEPRPYDGSDTHVDMGAAAALLEDHLRAQQAAQPHRPVDLVGHSMGGDVATYYLEHRHDPRDPGLPPVRSVATYGTPHGGSAVARLGRALGEGPVGAVAVESLLATGRALGVPGVEHLRIGVPPVDRYGGWRPPSRDVAALRDRGAELHAFTGSRDLVVGPRRAAPDGIDPVVLPGGHTSMLGTETEVRTSWDALAGREVAGEDGHLVGIGPDVVDALVTDLSVVVDVADVVFTGRPLRRGAAGLLRFLTGQQRVTPEVVEASP